MFIHFRTFAEYGTVFRLGSVQRWGGKGVFVVCSHTVLGWQSEGLGPLGYIIGGSQGVLGLGAPAVQGSYDLCVKGLGCTDDKVRSVHLPQPEPFSEQSRRSSPCGASQSKPASGCVYDCVPCFRQLPSYSFGGLNKLGKSKPEGRRSMLLS